MESIKAKSIVNYTKNRYWFNTLYNMNIYRGCSHGCIYCDSRSECYRIDNFDKVLYKDSALEIIRDDLRRKKVKGVINTGSMSDPYNPLEKQLLLTRHSLELINAYGFGIAIATKSDLVVRDIDILKEIKLHSPSLVMMTITTVDDALAKKIEPNAPSSTRRFEALKKLGDEGIDTCLLFMPILPWLTDSDDNIEAIIKNAYDSKVKYIFSSFAVTLRDSQREYYYNKLDEYFPGLKDKYINKYHDRYECSIEHINKKYELFKRTCKKYGILYSMKDISNDYQKEYIKEQIRLF